MQTRNRQIKTPASTSLACGTVSESFKDKPVSQPRRENTPKGGRMSAHPVFVLGRDGDSLTPTTASKARKLIRGDVAKKCWSKFGTFGIQMLESTREEVPDAAIGNDWGTKFDGYSVVVETENPINVMLILPDKKVIVKKLDERRTLRRARRHRNCRRRPARFDNRLRGPDWLAPSQAVLVHSRLKVIKELCRIYPVRSAAIEDVRFNHSKHRWGKNFSTVEIGKTRLRKAFEDKGIQVRKFEGWETKEIREKFRYKKTSVKSAEKFSAHCSDSLALAISVTTNQRIEPGEFVVIDDKYRPKRRRLHDTQPAKGGVRETYSRGTVFGLRKGLLIGTQKGKAVQLCGKTKGLYRFYDDKGKRGTTKSVTWISTNFKTRRTAIHPSAKADGPLA
jgi:RRXRR protein